MKVFNCKSHQLLLVHGCCPPPLVRLTAGHYSFEFDQVCVLHKSCYASCHVCCPVLYFLFCFFVIQFWLRSSVMVVRVHYHLNNLQKDRKTNTVRNGHMLQKLMKPIGARFQTFFPYFTFTGNNFAWTLDVYIKMVDQRCTIAKKTFSALLRPRPVWGFFSFLFPYVTADNAFHMWSQFWGLFKVGATGNLQYNLKNKIIIVINVILSQWKHRQLSVN